MPLFHHPFHLNPCWLKMGLVAVEGLRGKRMEKRERDEGSEEKNLKDKTS